MITPKFTFPLGADFKAGGMLKSYFETMLSGLTGNLDKLFYPFNTGCWSKSSFTDGGLEGWWPYEQYAYWLDGYVKCAYFSGNEAHFTKAKALIDNALQVVVRLTWTNDTGDAKQDFFYNDTFVGKVTRVTDTEMLMECYDKDKFNEVWVSFKNYPDLDPRVGDEFVVTHSGWVMETYPPQVTAEEITPVSSTPTINH